MVVYILPSNAKTLLGLLCNSNCILLCSHITLSSSSNVNIVEWLVSMPAVRFVLWSCSYHSFGLACRGYTFDRSSFDVLTKKFRGQVLGLRLGCMFKFRFRVYL